MYGVVNVKIVVELGVIYSHTKYVRFVVVSGCDVSE